MILGNVIKQTRIQQGKKIKDIAEEAQITISLLSQIENNKANPSINSLMAIAKALNTPISDFFEDHEIVASPVVKSYKRRPIQTQKGMTYYLLSPTRKDLSIEFKYNVYEKGGSNGSFHAHQGEECGLVLEGRLEVIYDGDTYTLEAGDSIYIDSTKPHTMKNAYDGRTIVVWVDSPPPSETYI
jgi:transcriptional regulator with XRE-family HTH domain